MSLSKPKGVRFSQDELERLQRAATAHGISVNEMIRRLVDKGLRVLERENFALNLAQADFDLKKTVQYPRQEIRAERAAENSRK